MDEKMTCFGISLNGEAALPSVETSKSENSTVQVKRVVYYTRVKLHTGIQNVI